MFSVSFYCFVSSSCVSDTLCVCSRMWSSCAPALQSPNVLKCQRFAWQWDPDLTECSSQIEQVAVHGVSAVYCLCDVWGLLCLQTRHGKDGEAPSNAAFVWRGGGGISVWRWDPDQIIPPVAAQIAGRPAMQAESDTASISCFLTLWVVLEETCGYTVCSLLVQVSLWKGQKVAVSLWSGAFGVVTESSHRAMRHHPETR